MIAQIILHRAPLTWWITHSIFQFDNITHCSGESTLKWRRYALVQHSATNCIPTLFLERERYGRLCLLLALSLSLFSPFQLCVWYKTGKHTQHTMKIPLYFIVTVQRIDREMSNKKKHIHMHERACTQRQPVNIGISTNKKNGDCILCYVVCCLWTTIHNRMM